MDAIFRGFESYDFEGDGKFQSGLATLNEGTNITKDVAKVLEMKLFYYNRFVKPIDPAGYKQWRSGSSQVPSMDCSAEQLEKLNQLTLSEPHSGTSKNNIEETSTDTGAPHLSFEEVIRLVQAGEEVPGVAKLDIQPSNQDPTPSQRERILKPWEMSSLSK